MTVLARARRIARNHDLGASELLAELLPLLADALAHSHEATLEAVKVVCEGQPSMAPLWNACAAAVADERAPGRFAQVRARMERAPRALARAAGAFLAGALAGESTPCLLTLSDSRSVSHTLRELIAGAASDSTAQVEALQVICGEGRPRFEGRRLAAELAGEKTGITLVTDAALTSFLPHCTAVLVGADAIGAERWINKVGTLGLAAAAALAGKPVYVVASRDKFASPALEARLVLSGGPPGEVWPEATGEVALANPYFESIPAELATLVLTDAGPITPVDLPSAVAAQTTDIQALIDSLARRD